MLLALSLVPALKQQFNELINRASQRKNIKNRTYYFFNNIINIEKFNLNLLKREKESYKDIDIYNIEYISFSCAQYSKCITHIIHKIRRGDGKSSSIQNN